jgi:hypothetical protein
MIDLRDRVSYRGGMWTLLKRLQARRVLPRLLGDLVLDNPAQASRSRPVLGGLFHEYRRVA